MSKIKKKYENENKKEKNKHNSSQTGSANKKYESHYLAIALIAFLLFEGFVFTNTKAADWKQSAEVLDVSQTVTQTLKDIAVTFSPIVEAYNNIDEFYQLAATEMTALLDFSEENPIEDIAMLTDGVAKFYEQASIEMASVLDVSSMPSWGGNVAGTSVSVY